MYESFGATLTFEGSVARASWADTCFENQLLYLLEINVLAGLLTDTSKGWNLFVRLCGTMTTLHKFSPQSSFRYVIILALECIHYHQRILLFKDIFSFLTVSKYGNTISMKNVTDFGVLDQWLSVNDTENDFGKLNFGKLRFDFPHRWLALAETLQLHSHQIKPQFVPYHQPL